MKTGFWNKTENNKFDFLDDKNIAEKMGLVRTPYTFLDGLCHSFAAALKYEFGYKIEVVIGKEDELIHAYAAHNGHYIDVRGANDNWDEFISKYDDTLKTHDRAKLKIRSIEDYMDEFDWDDPDSYSEIIADDCFALIDAHPEYYKVA